MRVRLIGPSMGHVSDHKIDAATAAFLAVQLGQRHTFVQANDIKLETPPIDITIDGDELRVKRATVEFWTEGDAFDGEVVLELGDR